MWTPDSHSAFALTCLKKPHKTLKNKHQQKCCKKQWVVWSCRQKHNTDISSLLHSERYIQFTPCMSTSRQKGWEINPNCKPPFRQCGGSQELTVSSTNTAVYPRPGSATPKAARKHWMVLKINLSGKFQKIGGHSGSSIREEDGVSGMGWVAWGWVWTMGMNKQRVEVRKPVSCCRMGLVSGICLDTCFFLASYYISVKFTPSLNALLNHPVCLMKEKVWKEMLVVWLVLNLQLSFPASGDREHSQGRLHAPRVNIPALYI